MGAEELLRLLPDELLSELALATGVNRYAKKLQGELIFKLLLHCILSYKDNSLRTMASAYESFAFKLLNPPAKSAHLCFSSISERLSVIKPAYFEQLYTACTERYGHLLTPCQPELIRFDSTIVALSGKLLKVGYQLQGGDARHMRQLKFTLGFSQLPVAVHFFTEQAHTSENAALKEAVLSFTPASGARMIRIFDRGITSRETYDKLSADNIPFISRLHPRSKQQACTANRLLQSLPTPTLTIHSDCLVYLFKDKCIKATYPLRCIQAVRKEDGREIAFITNIHELSAADITLLYKHRWDIEVFFRFLKQELNFSHLVSRSENGIKVMLYATLIAAILLLTYKKLNGLKGYKITRQKFVSELEQSLMKDFILLCGGDPSKAEYILRPAPE